MVQGDGGEVVWLDELVTHIRQWHELALKAGGGATGEHADRLFASCGRAFQTSFREDVFPTPFEKAAALFHGIVCNHAFVDGNKRTGTIPAILFLVGEGSIETVSPVELALLGVIALQTASSHMAVEDVTRWLHRILDP